MAGLGSGTNMHRGEASGTPGRLPTTPVEALIATGKQAASTSATASLLRLRELSKAKEQDPTPLTVTEANIKLREQGSGLVLSDDTTVGELEVQKKAYREQVELETVASSREPSIAMSGAKLAVGFAVPMLDPTELALSMGAASLLRAGARATGTLVRNMMIKEATKDTAEVAVKSAVGKIITKDVATRAVVSSAPFRMAEGALGGAAAESLNVYASNQAGIERDWASTMGTVAGMSMLFPALGSLAKRFTKSIKEVPAFVDKHIETIVQKENADLKVDALNPDNLKENAMTREDILARGETPEQMIEKANAPENKNWYDPDVAEINRTEYVKTETSARFEQSKAEFEASAAPDDLKADVSQKVSEVHAELEGNNRGLDILSHCLGRK